MQQEKYYLEKKLHEANETIEQMKNEIKVLKEELEKKNQTIAQFSQQSPEKIQSVNRNLESRIEYLSTYIENSRRVTTKLLSNLKNSFISNTELQIGSVL